MARQRPWSRFNNINEGTARASKREQKKKEKEKERKRGSAFSPPDFPRRSFTILYP